MENENGGGKQKAVERKEREVECARTAIRKGNWKGTQATSAAQN